ncbi:MAG: PH domain-containing protein [Halobacteriaceae archaeon]
MAEDSTDAEPSAAPDGQDAEHLAAAARGDSVTQSRLIDDGGGAFGGLAEGAILDHIEHGEQPHYILTSRTGGVRAETPEGTITRTSDRRRRSYCVVTDGRILFLLSRSDGDDRISVPYAAMTNIETSTGLLRKEVSVNTEASRYVFAPERTVSDDEFDAAMTYARERLHAAERDTASVDAGGIDEIRELVIEAADESVTLERLRAHDDLLLGALREAEQPQYILTGSGSRGIEVLVDGELAVQAGGAGEGVLESLDRLDRNTLTMVTDQRLVAVVPKTSGVARQVINFEDIVAVEIDESGQTPALQVRTDHRTCRFGVRAAERERLGDAVAYIDSRVGGGLPGASGEGETSDVDGDEASGDVSDPLDRLERLAALHEQGAISDEEFERKKADLLEKI